MTDVAEKATESSESHGSTRPEFDLYSCYYRNFFILRTSIAISERPAVIRTVDGEPVIRLSDGDGISVKLSTITQEAVVPILDKHGVYRIHPPYHEQVPLYSINFKSITSALPNFLMNKEAVEKELASAIMNCCKIESNLKLAKKQSMSPIHMALPSLSVSLRVYLMRPDIEESSQKAREVTLDNCHLILKEWRESKCFNFSNQMFTCGPVNNGECIIYMGCAIHLSN